jgi:hypothetical protein
MLLGLIEIIIASYILDAQQIVVAGAKVRTFLY